MNRPLLHISFPAVISSLSTALCLYVRGYCYFLLYFFGFPYFFLFRLFAVYKDLSFTVFLLTTDYLIPDLFKIHLNGHLSVLASYGYLRVARTLFCIVLNSPVMM